VACEAKGTQLWLEVPHHDSRIHRSRDELLHVGVEGHRGNCVLMSPERTFESRIHIGRHDLAVDIIFRGVRFQFPLRSGSRIIQNHFRDIF